MKSYTTTTASSLWAAAACLSASYYSCTITAALITPPATINTHNKQHQSFQRRRRSRSTNNSNHPAYNDYSTLPSCSNNPRSQRTAAAAAAPLHANKQNAWLSTPGGKLATAFSAIVFGVNTCTLAAVSLHASNVSADTDSNVVAARVVQQQEEGSVGVVSSSIQIPSFSPSGNNVNVGDVRIKDDDSSSIIAVVEKQKVVDAPKIATSLAGPVKEEDSSSAPVAVVVKNEEAAKKVPIEVAAANKEEAKSTANVIIAPAAALAKVDGSYIDDDDSSSSMIKLVSMSVSNPPSSSEESSVVASKPNVESESEKMAPDVTAAPLPTAAENNAESGVAVLSSASSPSVSVSSGLPSKEERSMGASNGESMSDLKCTCSVAGSKPIAAESSSVVSRDVKSNDDQDSDADDHLVLTANAGGVAGSSPSTARIIPALNMLVKENDDSADQLQKSVSYIEQSNVEKVNSEKVATVSSAVKEKSNDVAVADVGKVVDSSKCTPKIRRALALERDQFHAMGVGGPEKSIYAQFCP